jgi:hypothetical protein
MTPFIGSLIADIATSAIRGSANVPTALVVRPPPRPAPAPRLGDAPAFDLVLVKVELNLGR